MPRVISVLCALRLVLFLFANIYVFVCVCVCVYMCIHDLNIASYKYMWGGLFDQGGHENDFQRTDRLLNVCVHVCVCVHA